MSDERKISKTDPDYAVGYRKPPLATRFQPGQSGNPRGRCQGSKNLRTALERELNSLVTVQENGKRRKKPKRDVIASQLVNKSIAADMKALRMLLPIMAQIEKLAQQAAAEHAGTEETTSDVDDRIMANIIERAKGTQK